MKLAKTATCVVKKFCWGALAGALALLVGCAQDGPVPVSGKVTVDGVAIAGAGVVFHPKDGKGRQAHGETDDSGVYHLKTYKPGDGALRGDYTVTVVWDEQPHPYTTYRPGAPKMKELEKDYEAWKAKHKPKPSPIPAKYADVNKSPLRATVPAPGGVVDFAISTKQ